MQLLSALAASPLTTWRRLTERQRILAVVLLALLCRIGFLLIQGIDAPLVTWGDDLDYDEIARNLVDQGTYTNLWFPPGYPLFLGAIYAVFGPQVVIVRLAQALLGAATCALTYSIGKRIFGAGVGALAGVLLAIYPGHAFMSWRLMAESLYIFLIALSVLLALHLLEKPALSAAVGLGLTLGVANTVKSNLILFSLLVLIWVAVSLLRRRPRAFLAVAAMAASFALASVVTPVANLIASRGEFGLVAGNAGHTLWYSNNPAADGYFVDPYESEAARSFVERHGLTEVLRDADEFDKDPVYRDLALLWIGENPQAFVELCGKKLANAFGVLPRAAVFEGYPLAKWVHLISYGALLPFILAGVVLSLRRWRSAIVLYLVVASYVVMVLVYYGTPRFTVIILPFLLVFAGLGLTTLRRAIATKIQGHRQPG